MILATALLLCCLLGAAGEQAGEETPVAVLSAVEMTRRMGNGINLGNTLEACNSGAQGGMVSEDPHFYETSWGQPHHSGNAPGHEGRWL